MKKAWPAFSWRITIVSMNDMYLAGLFMQRMHSTITEDVCVIVILVRLMDFVF